MPKVIEVKDLVKDYKTTHVVRGVSFSVEKGEIFGILGPNGAGKTTTLEIIECLKPQTSGKVSVLGFDNLESPDKIKNKIGVQLQSSQYLHHLSLSELLDLFASFYGQKADKKMLLGLVGLEEKVNEEFSSLSGGQKQRFTIATSLVHEPEILFLDEPTTGLDPHARRNMWQLIKTINSRSITIVLTSHYMEEAEYLCNRVAIIDSGKILEINSPKKLIEQFSNTIQISFFVDESYPKVILEVSDLDKISTILNLLKQNNPNFYGLTVKTASLEDVYLKLTGKEYEEN